MSGTKMNAVIFDIDGTHLQSDANDDVMYLAAVRGALGNVNLRPNWGMYTQFTAAGILAESVKFKPSSALPSIAGAGLSGLLMGRGGKNCTT